MDALSQALSHYKCCYYPTQSAIIIMLTLSITCAWRCIYMQWIYWLYSLIQVVPCACTWHLLSCYFVKILGYTVRSEYAIIVLLTSCLVEYLNGIFHIFVCNCYIYMTEVVTFFISIGIHHTLYTVSHDVTSHFGCACFFHVVWTNAMCVFHGDYGVYIQYMYISVAISDR